MAALICITQQKITHTQHLHLFCDFSLPSRCKWDLEGLNIYAYNILTKLLNPRHILVAKYINMH